MIDIIKVKATNNTGKVALWERSTEQPYGEVFISGDGSVVEVANTANVRKAIKAGELVEVQPEAAKAPAKIDTKQEPATEKVTVHSLSSASFVETHEVPSAAIRQEGSKTTKR